MYKNGGLFYQKCRKRLPNPLTEIWQAFYGVFTMKMEVRGLIY